jgi:hypothetical protein
VIHPRSECRTVEVLDPHVDGQTCSVWAQPRMSRAEVSTAIGRDVTRAPGRLVGAGRRGTETPEQTILAGIPCRF